MDAFEVRMQFLTLLSRLTSSLASIQKVSSFALKHGPKCGDDIWDCLVEECGQVSLNARINLLYFLDTLIGDGESRLEAGSGGSGGSGRGKQPYKELVKRDLGRVVEMVVPQTKLGNLNLMSAEQVLKSWRTRRLLDTELLDSILSDLERRRTSLHSGSIPTPSESEEDSKHADFSRNDIIRRIEDDRERHKRLRERIWVLPVPTTLHTTPYNPSAPPPFSQPLASSFPTTSSDPFTSPTTPSSPSDLLPTKMRAKVKQQRLEAAAASQPSSPIKPPSGMVANGTAATAKGTGPELAIEIEFEQLWEACEEELGLALGLAAGSRGGLGPRVPWALGREEKLAMRAEAERCFVEGGLR